MFVDGDGNVRRSAAPASKPAPKAAPAKASEAGRLSVMFLQVGALMSICMWAFFIRMNAVFAFGKVIHEFDPWFNFRATQYLVDNGWDNFINWFDDQSWHPIGRPVGSTVYPVRTSRLFPPSLLTD
jgi:dolichyl-diphosphooligosaccharide--protein glycosyltransferase